MPAERMTTRFHVAVGKQPHLKKINFKLQRFTINFSVFNARYFIHGGDYIYSVSHFISYSILSWLSSLLPNKRERERERDLPSLDCMGYNFHLNLFTLFYHGVEVDFMSSNPPSCNDLDSFIIITSTMLFYGIIKFFAIFFFLFVCKN